MTTNEKKGNKANNNLKVLEEELACSYEHLLILKERMDITRTTYENVRAEYFHHLGAYQSLDRQLADISKAMTGRIKRSDIQERMKGYKQPSAFEKKIDNLSPDEAAKLLEALQGLIK